MKLSTKSLALLLGCSFLLFGCSSEDTKESNHKEKETVSNKGVKPIEELIYKQVDSRDDGYKDYYYRVYYNHANKCVSEQHMVEGGYSIPIMTSNYLLDSETKQPMCGKSIEEAKALFQVKEKSNDLNKG
ncbi:hypothetical protein AT268_32560 [Bacillus cereus]|uniref:Lipoprotein n=1 Tax=Bacillus cereus TaxID=1396 RepID=A0A9X0SPI1_BACCE|nr:MULTISPECIES: hypothetical protein [Bacillus cereus group]PEZ75377.1 hypothetical protein CN410_15035 [Bacillus anthracis]KXY51227.1 hypothetical protein AT268_32560 [Bacillus cereus]PES55164.1 hypothetical protein CN515_03650 [Bacillus cereus]PFA29565.1 hypothetical protein CN384_07675 [Bacillus thuringiensis]PGW10538.1 hypothetical protein COD97_16710 [Bacillus cereus]